MALAGEGDFYELFAIPYRFVLIAPESYQIAETEKKKHEIYLIEELFKHEVVAYKGKP